MNLRWDYIGVKKIWDNDPRTQQGKNEMKPSYRALLLLTAMLLAACSSSTKLVTRWHDTQYQGPKLEKVLVIGVFADDLMRRMFEDQFVAELQAMGRAGVASYVYIPDMKAVDEQKELDEVVARTGADAVLITTLKSIDEKKTQVPPRTEWAPAYPMAYGPGYYGYYYQAMVPVTRPGYTRTDTVARLETRVFSVQDRKLLWAGNTESFNPDSPAKVVRQIARLVVDDMKSAGLIE